MAISSLNSRDIIEIASINGRTLAELDSFNGRVLASGGFEAGYEAILTEGTFRGNTLPSAGQQILQNTLFKTINDGGVLSRHDLIHIMATDGDEDYANIMWKTPALFTLNPVNSPIFTSNLGWGGDGIAAFLETNFNLSTHSVNQQLNDACIWAWKTVNGTNSGGARLIGNSTNQTSYQLLDLNNAAFRLNTDISTLSGPFDGTRTGFICLNKPAAGQLQAWYATTKEFDDSLLTDLLALLNVTVRYLTRGVSSYSDSCIGAAGISGSLTPAQINTLYNALNTYMGSI